LARDRLPDPGQLSVAAFAYQYRDAPGTTHHEHADLVFSRMGIARAGTSSSRYYPVRRCFSGPARRLLRVSRHRP
jgi:hypothetical protein